VKILGRFIKPTTQSASQKKIITADHARSTSQKIDTIESEITAEFGNATLLQDSKEHSRNSISNLSHALDEATFLFANGQSNDAKTHLLAATQINGSEQDNKLAWWMLFDLAIIENQPDFFDQLALSYAKQFETSPPQWQPLIHENEHIPSQTELPILNFRGKLSEASLPAVRQLELLGLQHHHFQVEFSAITEMDMFGCSAILNVLDTWQKASCDISVRDGGTIISRVRQFTQAGRRDSNDAAWRLLIELLRLMNAQEAYENACLEYCMTYEVSPPASPPAPTKSPEQIPVFAMPQNISLPIDKLLMRTSEYAQQASVVVLDCRHLRKIEFSAVTPWLTGLKQLAQSKAVECRQMSFLVGRLIQLMGATSWLHITHRKP
jgi:anti-anti-sigma regulatory factor